MQVDVGRHIGAVVREVHNRDHKGKPARVVVAVRDYASDIDDVWDALTSAERIPRWFMPITGDLRVGGRYQLKGNAGGEVLACDPPRELNITWEFGGNTSWVSVRLTEDVAGTTRLELEHIAHVPEEFWEQYGPGATGVGWEMGLMGLDMHLAGEPAVDPQEAAAWGVSDEGKDFTRRSSELWGAASIANGTDPALANASAARTTAFYTGEQV